MRPFELVVVEIPFVVLGNYEFNKLEIDLRHINYGLDPKTKEFRKKARSKFSIEEVIRIFQLLDGLVIEEASRSNGYIYFALEVYILWLKAWFKVIICVAEASPKTAGVITIYRIKESRK